MICCMIPLVSGHKADQNHSYFRTRITHHFYNVAAKYQEEEAVIHTDGNL